jgi:RNA polymerase sigma-70 factor (ECF subfamily)
VSSKLSRLPDEKLIKRVLSGDTRAYGVLYERYLDEIYRYVYYRVAKNSLETEDLTQVVFIKAWDVILQDRAENYNFRALIYQIAHNLVIDRWRTLKTELLIDEQLMEGAIPKPEQQIIMNEESDELVRVIRELEPKLQEVVICRFINELSHAETARSLGLTEGYVRVLQYRALKKMRVLINE